jgi:hypothetical protein
MSETLDKQCLIDWLKELIWSEHASAYNLVRNEIESGRFDTPDSEGAL